MALSFLRKLLRRRAFEAELDQELQLHLELETERNMKKGMDEAAARARARADFGGVERFKDEVRDARGLTALDDVARDVRFALRTLRKSPGFVVVAVLCLSLGIGANAALFSVLNAVLLRPLPYAQPERLVRVFETQPARGPNWTGSVSWPNFVDFREQAKSFEHLVAYQVAGMNLSGQAGPSQRVRASFATEGFFEALRPRLLLGRPFTPEEHVRGKEHVAILSERAWEERFGRNPAVLGKTLTLDGSPYEIVGVAADAFRFPPQGDRSDLFAPYVPQPRQETARGSHYLFVLGQLGAGATLESANAELKQIAARLAEAYPQQQGGRSASVASFTEVLVGFFRPALLLLLGAVALVLLIACANVANLLLARGAARRQEVALRLALGASRARIVGQLLVESLILALGGAALGVLIAQWGLAALKPLAQRALPMVETLSLDLRVLAFLAGISLISAVLFGWVPALQATRLDLRAGMSEATRATGSGSARRFRSALVVSELALSLVLLVGAGLLLRGFSELIATPSGMEPSGVLTARLSVPPAKFAERPISSELLFPSLERARALPGVTHAGAISLLPIQAAWVNGDYALEGAPKPEPGKEPQAEYRVSTPGVFKALGIPLLAGREFTEQDGEEGSLGILVNRALEKEAFHGESAVGKRLLLDGTPIPILGVVGDVRQAGLDRAPMPEIHVPYRWKEVAAWTTDMTLVVKTPLPPLSLAPSLREAVASVDPQQPLYDVLTLEEVIVRSTSNRRLNLILLGSFAAIALLLSAAGLYGVLAYLVAQRTQEIGVRMALGAQATDVIRMVMKEGGRLAALGIALGLAGALALGRLIESLLFSVSVRDPATLAVVPAVLAAVALVACYLPARRAARVDPVLAIKAD